MTPKQFDSVISWLNALDSATDIPAALVRQDGTSEKFTCRMLSHSSSSVTVEPVYPDMPSVFHLDPIYSTACLSAPEDQADRFCLFHSVDARDQLTRKARALTDARANFLYLAKRASPLQIEAAMACLRGRVPDEALIKIPHD